MGAWMGGSKGNFHCTLSDEKEIFISQLGAGKPRVSVIDRAHLLLPTLFGSFLGILEKMRTLLALRSIYYYTSWEKSRELGF